MGEKKALDQDEYLILPDEELRELFRKDKLMLKVISLPMLAILYLLFLTAPDIVLGAADAGLVPISAAAGLICYSFIFSNDPEKQKKRVFALDLFQLALLVLGYILGNPITTGYQIGFMVASNGANIIAHKIIRDLNILRNHPRYPFDNWRRDESYTKAIYSNGSYTDRAISRLEGTLNSGKVRTVGGEEFFDGERKAYAVPEHDRAQDLQQREQVWRGHDKSDTSYTMDNLKNMYLGSPEKGELDSRELEKMLWEETAPKKPKAPPEEDFFQQSPVIWRTNKDGTTTMERRAPGSKPAGEFDSRSVLP